MGKYKIIQNYYMSVYFDSYYFCIVKFTKNNILNLTDDEKADYDNEADSCVILDDNLIYWSNNKEYVLRYFNGDRIPFMLNDLKKLTLENSFRDLITMIFDQE